MNNEFVGFAGGKAHKFINRMASIAKVIVDLALNREFDYLIPDRLCDRLQPGWRVVVPFGKRETTGFVVALADSSPVEKIKPITDMVGDAPMVSDRLLELARWMAAYYCVPIEKAVQSVLPAAVRHRDARFKARLYVLPTALATPAAISRLASRAPRAAVVLQRLLENNGMFMADLLRAAHTTAATVHNLKRHGLAEIAPRRTERDPLETHRTMVRTQPLTPMPDQAVAIAAITKAIDTGAPSVFLLHGVTGSGKTEVYMQAIARVLAADRSAIMLVPEISLTPQTIDLFHARFGEIIAVLHSSLSDGERHDEWHRIREGRARVVIGARSAVFAPVATPGLIVVDEEHENSYKQDETPRYNARDVAVMRGYLEKCPVVLGSATPSLESLANAARGKYQRIGMPVRVDNRRMPVMRIVDMRVDAEQTGKISAFSRDLVEAMRDRLARSEQTILFLNRRGYATSLICPKCGFVARCKQCSVAYTYHRTTGALHCHICGATAAVPAVCPDPVCRDPAFRYAGIGTQKVEEIVRKLMPGARVQRMDADVTTTRGSHRQILGDFRAGKIDILIGTQMIAKGLDFPNVTLIGVVCADTTLHMPDFRAGERTFQLLVQVAGRAGRGEIPGEVFVQTYTPFNPAIQAARALDYDGFCDQELAFRKELRYPPYAHLVCLTVRCEQEATVMQATGEFVKQLKPHLHRDVCVGGPTPAPLARAKGFYRYQVILRATNTRSITRPVLELLAAFKWPSGVDTILDVDALSIM